ncbi:hypothetical protein HET69_12700 [Streptomyces sp. CJ_13]|uniref:hypothetical protein n=1 Tax=Streptomyces TaxID=1883 RepID=UPI001BDDAE5F|nr:hypothetical protein [Streptomyces sp. CJ_13]MBT1184869.1 hypothetical protein [Streptomyces sp. CJ_13]
MSGKQDKHQQPGKGREEQERHQRPGQDEPKDMQGLPSSERTIQNPSREREQEMDDGMRDDEL